LPRMVYTVRTLTMTSPPQRVRAATRSRKWDQYTGLWPDQRRPVSHGAPTTFG
jgi:hypothetical protein